MESLEDKIIKLQETNAALMLSNNELAKNIIDKIPEVDEKVNAKLLEADAHVGLNGLAFTQHEKLYYDYKYAFSKASLNILRDSQDNTKSEWVPLVGAQSSAEVTSQFSPSKLTLVDMVSSTSAPPGYYENPQYGVDKSMTVLELLVGSVDLTSEEINQYITESGLTLTKVGSWSVTAKCVKIKTIDTPGKSSSRTLFARFVNVKYEADANVVAQDVTMFGGPMVFYIDCVRQYRGVSDVAD